MAGLLGSYSDSTCNTHNVLRNISEYACGVTFSFKDTADPPPDMHYAVVSLQKCCDKVNRPVMRVPGNTGCEIQFCEVPEVTSSYSYSVFYGYTTGSGTAAKTPEPTVTQGTISSWPEEVDNCMRFVYEGDLPENIAKDIENAGSWCAVRMYDDELSPSEEETAVTAAPAPPSWTTAAIDQWDLWMSSESAAKASATATPTSNSGHGIYTDNRSSTGVRIWAVAALVTLGLAAAL
ncbi:hypothetical protein F5Y04DRAFT_209437 [Hypomontagnella monticulosa]|nr:hypothetical protein F5Y04DRAFT_209437 [Hypomontagnella monticulosa]